MKKLLKDNLVKRIVFSGIVLIFVYWIFNNLAMFGSVIGNFVGIIMPFITGLVIAFIFNVPMRFIEKHLFKGEKFEKKPLKSRAHTSIYLTGGERLMESTNENEATEILNRLVEQYQTPLRRMCFIMLRDEELAKDAVQDTFLKVYKNIDVFRGECSEKTWLMQIAVNTCRDVKRSAWFRHLDRRITLEDLPEPSVQPAESAVELTMEIMRLPRKFREIILLYFYQQMTTREIAEILHIPQSTVATRLKKAREKLRVSLEGGERG